MVEKKNQMMKKKIIKTILDVGHMFNEHKWTRGRPSISFKILNKGLMNTNEQGEGHQNHLKYWIKDG